MRKILFIILGSLMTFGALAQESLSNENKSNLSTDLSLSSSRVYRGVRLGETPTIGGKVSYDFCDWFALSTNAIFTTHTGSGYGSSLENVATIKNGKFKLNVSDMYFFYGEGADQNNYFNYGKDTRHLINGSLKYTAKHYYGLVESNLYRADADNNKGVYFEAGFNVVNEFKLVGGYVTDASTTSFRNSAGFTHLGFTTSNEVKLSSCIKPKVTTGFYVNPSYKNVVVADGVSQSPFQFTVGLEF